MSGCPSLPRSWAQGPALEERFSTIWKTRFQAFRDRSSRKTGVCADCLHERLAQPESF